SEAVEYASKMKLTAVSVTDHDSVDGIDEALEAASKTGMEVIPGIELSSEIGDSAKNEMHILGYHIDYKSAELKETLEIFKKARFKRAKEILEKLKKNGIDIKDKSFLDKAENKAIGRLHFAKSLIEEGYVNSISEAFQKYLSLGKAAYVPKYAISAYDAINLIKRAGGVPVMAHPYYTHYNDKAMLRLLVDGGLMGLEAWHVKHPDSAVKKILSLAEEYDLIVTGGSDCHGPYKDEAPIIGTVRVPYSVVEKLDAVRRGR
ncbi:MAG: PHP domain-containing protein, partial [Endomicrobia bacterium]|nr:PHP domain-containing protein [Endomicrobiia bacterium]